ncbi:MAG: hypothetical protein COV74_07910 [Candidatus Omnitrophica bacterium CG11_big_fil_rev_8_21_14_0_20_45_26]|uniref:Chloroplast import component protein (Tic20) n=1 Tax=Candidatus Abzuiibacterium crystallinum TaxID=1974748 RepID=A0A2H0LQ41_9BACT|nr:MAG: hypothetical protein COV74_07910 [Candidatus Omnitrophica bacterium CG11_big_fil_rev_8_21_14_0_20_45_26]PIW65146.1 MAG: hypothetical protein COW12_02950 [Candidatus Omnitrophica bacterium CG12_big_fil_rev_8_21_14_0_65_45_16]
MENTSKQQTEPSAEIQEGKFFAISGYLFVLCFVPLLLKKDNKFAQFHGRQGLVLFIFELAAAIVKSVPVIGDVIFSFAYVIFGIASLIGIVRVLMNEYWEMPLVHNIARKITL